MATPVYSQSDFYEIVDGMVHQKFPQVNDRQVISNRAVRFVLGDMDLRSSKRSATLSPNMFSDVYDYAAPSDLKNHKIVDIKKQVNRQTNDHWILVDETDFDRYKTIYNHRIAIKDANFSQILRIDGIEGTEKTTIHNCDSLTANGTWAVATDASNLTLDTSNYITGSGSINFDTAEGATTAVVRNLTMTAIDLSDYDEKGSIFVWVFIPDYSDASGDTVTSFTLQWGQDSDNRWTRTVSTTSEGLTFRDGWNLLRFDWNGATENGTVDPAAITAIYFTINKPTTFAADTDWRLDDIVIRMGDIYDVIYYSKFGWQTSAAAYIEESTTTTDLLIADTDEVEIIATKAAEFASQELRDYEDTKYFKEEYGQLKRAYESNYHSEALKLHNSYYSLPQRRR